MPLERFRYGQRVRISDPHHHLFERRGTVVVVSERNGSARVRIEGGLPDDQNIILEGIAYPDETILYPGHCEAIR
jgi:hypothetical protein